MNFNTLDELFLEWSSHLARSPESIKKNKKLCAAWNNAAKFKLGFPETIENYQEVASNAFVGSKLALPYSSVKIIDTVPSLGNEECGWLFWSNGVTVTMMQFNLQKHGSYERYAGPIATMIYARTTEDKLIRRGKEAVLLDNGDFFMIRPFYSSGRSATQDEPGYRSSLSGSLGCLVDHCLYFCELTNCPRNYLCRVRPSKNQQAGRSVQWVAAKSHYLVLGAEHAKLLRDGKPRDFEGTVTRAMHMRRAHARTLTSERFTKKKGLKIWVNSAWIGPKNWEGADKKIYEIQEKSTNYSKPATV